ncbi:PREDICTED: spermatogenesis-associated protein 16 isoform X3 [Lepidothrix coronata]|uniref:Spermatogenesis-associated protein 16 isoform X3 n=1 Tax=Lepidothrix coronata TaxID=321398 RepID=A0A6J0J9T6_9PASS|nr:PREDICTED: spermatogenesis-associated protein 16 isoform X3 [Lepidothrix coronata]
METQQVSQELGLSQWFPSHMFPQEGSSSRAPEAWQGAEQHKEQPRAGTDRGNCKTKGDSHEDLTGTKAGAQLEPGVGIFPSPPLHIPPGKLREIEAQLVCADEADTEFGFGDLALPGVTPPAHQAPARPPEGSPWRCVDARLQLLLQEGSARCRQEQFAAAAAKFYTALELCSRGFATEDPLKSSPDDISRVASFIESKLVICYLKLGQPDIALSHSHRSIIQNPSYFRNHLRQAACFRCLQRYSEAARSAMIADCLYILAGGTALETSDLIQLYWQALIQEALSGEVSFSVLYTPFEKEDEADKIKEANKSFAEKHPDYVQHIFTDPHGIHLLPERAESLPDQEYLLTLGFRNREIGKTVEKSVIRKLPICPGVCGDTSLCVWKGRVLLGCASCCTCSASIQKGSGSCFRNRVPEQDHTVQAERVFRALNDPSKTKPLIQRAGGKAGFTWEQRWAQSQSCSAAGDQHLRHRLDHFCFLQSIPQLSSSWKYDFILFTSRRS